MKKDYSKLVGMIGERNRPSGGIKTIHEAIIQCSINSNSKVLEIGSNTGFTSVQIARLTGASMVGIDVNSESITKAIKYAKEHNVDSSVKFIEASAVNLPFDDNTFDTVWASNVTSFIDDKNKAIQEYVRVLKPNGYLVFVPIYYVNEPPKDLVESVGEAIGTKLPVYKKKDWLNMVSSGSMHSDCILDLVYEQDYRYDDKTSDINEYIDYQISKIKGFLDKELFDEVYKSYSDQITLFNKNLTYAGYSVFVFQKNLVAEDPELFTTYKV